MSKDNKSKSAVYQGEISKFQDRHKIVIKRYMFLNSRALLAYKDQVSFYNSPSKPWLVIPLGEIANIDVYSVENLQ